MKKRKRIFACFAAVLMSLCLCVTILPSVSAAGIVDKELCDPYIDENIRLANAPTVVTEVKSSADVEALRANRLEGDMRPTNAVLHVDKDMNVIDAAGEKIDTLANVWTGVLGKRIIACVYIEDLEVAEAYVSFYNNTLQIVDSAVVSANASVMGYLRGQLVSVRGIMDYRDTDKSAAEMVAEANANGAATLLLNAAQADVETVGYIQARAKTVWAACADGAEAIANAVVSGVFGVVVNDYQKAYEVLESFGENVLTRASLDVAHRGLYNSSPENSAEGCVAAEKAGATHVEVDVYLTTDNEVVVMHDATLDRTTTGSGRVEDMTLAQIKQYKINFINNQEIGDSSKWVEIPTLEEVMDALKGTDMIIVIEIKSAKSEISQYIAEILNKAEYSEYLGKTVVISFTLNHLKQSYKYMPQIPTAYLGSVSTAQNIYDCVAANAAFDPDFGVIGANKKYTARGYAGWFWTAGDETGIATYLSRGVFGVTNNAANVFSDLPQVVTLKEDYSSKSFNTLEELSASGLKANVRTYDGTVSETDAVIVATFFPDENDFRKVGVIVGVPMVVGNKDFVMVANECFVVNVAFENVLALNDKIADLPQTIALSDGAALEDIREIYDQLSDTEKSLVSGYDTFLVAESTYLKLEAEDVRNRIAALPDTITLKNEDEIRKLREDYDALTADQKKNVDNISKLNLAEQTLEYLLENAPKDSPNNVTLYVLIGVGVALLAAAVIVVIVIKKKKRKA